MNILHVSPSYPPCWGGNEVYVKELSEHLAKLDCRVTVLTTNAGHERSFVLPGKHLLQRGTSVENGVEVRRLRINYGIHRSLRWVARRRGGWRTMRAILGDWVVNEMIHMGPVVPTLPFSIMRSRADCVMSTNYTSLTPYYAALGAKAARLPFVFIPCLHPLVTGPPSEKGRWLFRAADAVVALTQYEKEYIADLGVEEHKIHVIGAGIDPERFPRHHDSHTFGNNAFVVGFVGRMMPYKGWDVLIQAMTKVWTHCPKAELVLAGTIAKRESLEAELSKIPQDQRHRVKCILDFSEEEKDAIYDSCDVLAVPSSGESFGIVYLEAWLHRKPVIGCLGGAPEAVIEHGRDGLLTRFGDVDHLAEAILTLAKSPSMRQKMGEAGWQKVQTKYTWKIVAEQIFEVYASLCPKPKISSL